MAEPPYALVRGVLTPEHYTVFGYITAHYAYLEVGMRITLAGYLGQGLTMALALTAPYSSTNLRNAMKAATKLAFREDAKMRELIIEKIGVLSAVSTLRNDIAHNIWKEGDRPDSIAPCYMDIRAERAEFKGFQEKNRDYTMGELQEAANKLHYANEFLAALHRTPEFQASIERNTSAISQAKDSSEGIS
jgi:hypothetical protein